MMNFTLANYKTADGALSAAKMSEIVRLSGARTFIETGTYLGDTVSAMREIFDRIYSIELSKELHQQAVVRFMGDEKITLLQGDSAEKLPEAAHLSGDSGAIFWLDAHWSGGNTARATENTPIADELKRIRDCRLDRSIVIVDDLRYFIDVPPGFDVHEANYGYPLLRKLMAQVGELWPTHVPIVNGDLLFIFPAEVCTGFQVSEVLKATNWLRWGWEDTQQRSAMEAVVAAAAGEEREVIMTLPETFKHSLNYGIGGEYLYWRALVHEKEGRLEAAAADLQLARKCGVRIAPRHWEVIT